MSTLLDCNVCNTNQRPETQHVQIQIQVKKVKVKAKERTVLILYLLTITVSCHLKNPGESWIHDSMFIHCRQETWVIDPNDDRGVNSTIFLDDVLRLLQHMKEGDIDDIMMTVN